jgi:hypothetical protein
MLAPVSGWVRILGTIGACSVAVSVVNNHVPAPASVTATTAYAVRVRLAIRLRFGAAAASGGVSDAGALNLACVGKLREESSAVVSIADFSLGGREAGSW